MAMNIVTGYDAGTSLSGTAGGDLIYGFDPNAAYASATIAATRVATGARPAALRHRAAWGYQPAVHRREDRHIKILDLNTGQVLATLFLNVPVDTASERGLLGLAFDPNYASNGLFYIYRTSPGPENEVLRYQVSADPNVANGEPARWCSTSGPPPTATTMPAGSGSVRTAISISIPANVGVAANAQDLTNQLGKILRIDVSSGAGYTIPADNPFVGDGGGVREEIFAYGLRNPWRSSFDSATGTFFIGDVGGARSRRSISARAARTTAGRPPKGVSANPAFVNPIHAYPHGAAASITGGYVYRGETDGLNGQYFFADFATGRVFTLRFDGTSWVATERTAQVQADVGTIKLPASFGEDARGNLYIVDLDGEIFRLTPPSPRPTSATRCAASPAMTGCSAAPAATCSTAGPARTSSTAAAAMTSSSIARATAPTRCSVSSRRRQRGSHQPLGVCGHRVVRRRAGARHPGQCRYGDRSQRRRHAHPAQCGARQPQRGRLRARLTGRQQLHGERQRADRRRRRRRHDDVRLPADRRDGHPLGQQGDRSPARRARPC